MMAKITKGSSSSGLLNYILDEKKNAEIIAIEGLRDCDKDSMIADFEAQASLNERVNKKVGHISLNFMKEDLENLTDETMAKIAEEYLTEMEIVDTQFVVARHFDKEHPHCHICFNRINNEGKTISDSNERFKSSEICKKLTEKYGLNFSEGKVNIKRDRLKGEQKVKHEIYSAIKECLPKCNDWTDLALNLSRHDIGLQFKTKENTGKIEGVIFSKGDYAFGGSKIDKKFSYGNIEKSFSKSLEQSSSVQKTATVSPLNNFIPKVNIFKAVKGIKSSGGGGSSAPSPVLVGNEKKRKKKKRKRGITYY